MFKLEQGTTIESAFKALSSLFFAKKIATPALDARLLIQMVTSLDHARFILENDKILTPDELKSLTDFVERRLMGEPVSRLEGKREFFGRTFVISPHTLDPRPDTETLIETSLTHLNPKNPIRILDMGTGSGAIIITLMCEFPHATGIATDISPEAIQTAKKNAKFHDVDDRIKFINTSWAEGLDGKFDLILSNPPYIPSNDIAKLEREVKNFDPELALSGGDDGLVAYKALIPQIHPILENEGYLLLEIGQNQGDDVRSLLKKHGFVTNAKNEQFICDLNGVERCILARLSQGCGI